MSKPTDIPAFPIQTRDVRGNFNSPETGMTLRDYFAAKAMQAVIASPRIMTVDDNPIQELDEIAACAYHMADAMLTERAKRT